MMWIAYAVNTVAMIFLAGIVVLHLIEHKNHDHWDDQ